MKSCIASEKLMEKQKSFKKKKKSNSIRILRCDAMWLTGILWKTQPVSSFGFRVNIRLAINICFGCVDRLLFLLPLVLLFSLRSVCVDDVCCSFVQDLFEYKLVAIKNDTCARSFIEATSFVRAQKKKTPTS